MQHSHIVRMRRRHLQRQEVLTHALAKHFGHGVQLTGVSGGNHLLVWPDQLTER
jgi:DNA-binding transcriptional MocR family regulator